MNSAIAFMRKSSRNQTKPLLGIETKYSMLLIGLVLLGRNQTKPLLGIETWPCTRRRTARIGRNQTKPLLGIETFDILVKQGSL